MDGQQRLIDGHLDGSVGDRDQQHAGLILLGDLDGVVVVAVDAQDEDLVRDRVEVRVHDVVVPHEPLVCHKQASLMVLLQGVASVSWKLT